MSKENFKNNWICFMLKEVYSLMIIRMTKAKKENFKNNWICFMLKEVYSLMIIRMTKEKKCH
jgi:hypothetical protein